MAQLTHVDKVIGEIAITIEAVNNKTISEREATVNQKLLHSVLTGKKDQLQHNKHTGNKEPMSFYK